jgi:hypothetical protein
MIQTLHVKPGPESLRHVFTTLNDVAGTQPICRILTSLIWADIDTLQYAHLFMHHTVRTLHLHLPDPSNSTISQRAILNISLRMPLLQCLHITSTDQLGTSNNTFVKLLHNLPLLKSFSLENAHLSEDMFMQLSTLTLLTTLLSNYGPQEVNDQFFPRTMASNAFPNLRAVTFTTLPDNMSTFLTASCTYHLTKLHMTSSHLPDGIDNQSDNKLAVSSFITTISTHCPNLEDLNLNFIRYSSELSDDPPHELVFDFATLRPLTTLSCLMYLGVSHEYSFLLDDQQVTHLVSHWHNLKGLSLNPYPIQTPLPTLPIKVLVSLAARCPTIEHLALHLDCSERAMLDLPPPWKATPFKSLRHLDVGMSPLVLKDWQIGTSSYLAHLCPNVASIRTHIPWRGQLTLMRSMTPNFEPDILDDEFISHIEDLASHREQVWIKVSKLFSRFRTLHNPYPCL